MKFKIVTIIIVQVITCNILSAQTKRRFFSKGDLVPVNMILGKLVNHKMSKAKFADFKGKLVILDFWSTHCGPCVASLPRMDSLQRRYGNKIAIIPITAEDSYKIRDYFKKRKFILPSIVEDRTLSKIFPQTALDLHVWIDEKGKIIATTSGDEVNFRTVGEYFKSGRLNVKGRLDIVGIFDGSKPLFVEGNGGSGEDFVGRSIMTNKHLVGVQTGGRNVESYIGKNGVRFLKRLCFWNSSPVNVFFPALFYFEKGNINLLYEEIETGEIIPFAKASSLKQAFEIFDKYASVKGDNVINYELAIPSPGVEERVFLRKYLLEDLNRYFDFSIRIEKIKVPSWIIINIGNNKDVLSKVNNENRHIIFDDNISPLFIEGIKSMSMDDFVKLINSSYLMPPPIFNETKLYSAKLNLSLHIKYLENDALYKSMDLEEWRTALQRNGFDIKVEDREVEVMVFKKKDIPSK